MRTSSRRAALAVLAGGVSAGFMPSVQWPAPGTQPGVHSANQPFAPTGTAQVLWTPLNITSATLVEWWDPTQGITLNGSNVASWTGRVSGIVASQSAAANQPSYSATARNSAPGIVFGNGQTLNFNTPSNFPLNASNGILVVVGYTSSVNDNIKLISFGGNNPYSFRQIAAVSSGVRFSAYYDDFTTTVTWLNNDRIVICSQSGGTSILFDVDGIAYSGTLPNALATTQAAGYIGSSGNTVQDTLVLSGNLSSSEGAKLRGYLAWKNNLVSHLPSGDPYLSRPPYTSDP